MYKTSAIMKIQVLNTATVKLGETVSFMLSGGYKSGVITSLLDLENVHIHYECTDLSTNKISHHIAQRNLLSGEIFKLS